MVDGVHDMGGMHGFGPVEHEDNEPVFHEWWEGHVYAMTRAGNLNLFPNLDTSRFYLEMLPPAEYLSSTYYERWLLRNQRRMLDLGLFTEEELEDRLAYYREHPDDPIPRRSDPSNVEKAKARFLGKPEPLNRPDGKAPRFKVGDQVRTRNIHPKTHTRLPRYARGKIGVVTRVHGRHDLPDTMAHGKGANPEGLYSVRFDPRELWGPDAEGKGVVHIDLWDSYLEPADQR